MNPRNVDRVKNKNKEFSGNEIEEIKRSEIIDVNNLVDECMTEHLNKCDDKVESVALSPVFNLTLEEEFKIHELLVRREFLYDEMFKLYLQISTFENWEIFLMSICRGQFDHAGKWNMFDRFENDYYSNLKKMNGIPVQASLNMFEGFQNHGEKVKSEMLEFTMPIQFIFIR